MKKIMIALVAVALPMMMQAQSEGLFSRKTPKGAKVDVSAYAAKGAIPEENGKVVFKDVITAPGKTKDDIFAKVAQWASLRYEPNSMRGSYTDADFFKNIEYSKVKSADKQSGAIECQGAEEMIFTAKALVKNYTQAFYLLNLKASDGKVEFKLHTLSYNVDQGEGQFLRVAAEEWVTDKECLNKKGEMRRIPSKYRIKTIDLVEELKKEISEAINQ
ncbi:MAG: DUF4468 domain-containing protein [Bacteroidaceae bacterium]|nr:DUF4468 domain-containing protein [Bacteroidaceae bacterium]